MGHMINTGNFETVNAHAAYLIHLSVGTFSILETNKKRYWRSNQIVTDLQIVERYCFRYITPNAIECSALKWGMEIMYIGLK